MNASSHIAEVRFDAKGLVANAGLVLPATLGERQAGPGGAGGGGGRPHRGRRLTDPTHAGPVIAACISPARRRAVPTMEMDAGSACPCSAASCRGSPAAAGARWHPPPAWCATRANVSGTTTCASIRSNRPFSSFVRSAPVRRVPCTSDGSCSGVASHGDDNLPCRVPFRKVPDSLRSLGQRIGLPHYRRDRAGLDQLGQRVEVLAPHP